MYATKDLESLCLRYENAFLTFEEEFLKLRSIYKRRRKPGVLKSVLGVGASVLAALVISYIFHYLLYAVSVMDILQVGFGEALARVLEVYPDFFRLTWFFRAAMDFPRWDSDGARALSVFYILVCWILPPAVVFLLRRKISEKSIEAVSEQARQVYHTFLEVEEECWRSYSGMVSVLLADSVGNHELEREANAQSVRSQAYNDMRQCIAKEREDFFWCDTNGTAVSLFENYIYFLAGDADTVMHRQAFDGCHWETEDQKNWPEWYARWRQV